MKPGEQVKLRSDSTVLDKIKEMIGDKVGRIVGEDEMRDWIVQFEDVPRVGGQFAFDEEDLELVGEK